MKNTETAMAEVEHVEHQGGGGRAHLLREGDLPLSSVGFGFPGPAAPAR